MPAPSGHAPVKRRNSSLEELDSAEPVPSRLEMDLAVYPIHNLCDFGFPSANIPNNKMIGVA